MTSDRRPLRPFLWHALFDGTPLCWCWHSQEVKARRALYRTRR